METNKIQDKFDKKICIALMATSVVLIAQYLILIYFNLLESSTGSSIQLFSKVLVGLAYLYALPTVLRISKIKFIESYFIAVFVFLIHYAVFLENRTYIIDLIFPFFFMSLPAFIYTLSIHDLSIFKGIMKKFSYIVFIIGLLIGVLVFSGRASIGAYSMSLSYYMLLPTILFIDEMLDKFSIKILVLTLLSLIIIVSLGSRGPVLCIIVFVVLKLFRPTNSKRTYKRILVKFSLFGIGAVSLLFMEQIIMNIYNILMKFGISSRTLLLFLQRGVRLSGRDKIYKDVMIEIFESPLIGIGIAGDRRIIEGSYAHNFFIELIGNFGFILGALISVGIILLIIKSVLLKDRDKYNMTIIWMSLGFVNLMVSSSYLTDIKFWIFLGLIVNINSKKIINVEGE